MIINVNYVDAMLQVMTRCSTRQQDQLTELHSKIYMDVYNSIHTRHTAACKLSH